MTDEYKNYLKISKDNIASKELEDYHIATEIFHEQQFAKKLQEKVSSRQFEMMAIKDENDIQNSQLILVKDNHDESADKQWIIDNISKIKNNHNLYFLVEFAS